MEPKYWEDFRVGDSWISPGRTVSAVDVTMFAMLSADWMPLHTDRVAAQDSPYGERIAHGLLGLTIASGLFVRTEAAIAIQTTVLALLGLEWKFTAPILFEDTVHLKVTVTSTRETSKPGQGIVVLTRELINQHGKVVQVGTTPIMLRRRPA